MDAPFRPTLKTSAVLLAVLGFAALACRTRGELEEGREAPSTGVSSAARPALVLDDEGHPAGLHRFRQWTSELSQGAQPEGEVAFANLAALGFKTVISVDGAEPDVANAEKHGLRYVHVPIGYDGIPSDAALKIVKAVETSDGPVYIHCHHGKHRGPAAAAIARIAKGDADTVEAEADLADSGCSPSYQGLYRDVRNFRMPSAAELAGVRPSDLPSVVKPEGLVDAMVHMDERFGFLKDSKAAGWAPPPKSPDVDPAHEAGMLENTLRSLLEEEERGRRREDFLRFLRESRQAASDLEHALRDGRGDPAEAWGRLEQACDACHREYRN
jgi:protein tyrosine phosphatase (PTP) superfamily phosphohydrolase (DUF442 family)